MKKKVLFGLGALVFASAMTLNVSLFTKSYQSGEITLESLINFAKADDESGAGGGPSCKGPLCDEANGLKYNTSKTTCCGESATYRGRKSS